MDPNEAWKRLLEAHEHKQYVEAAEHAESLLSWLRKDGFSPVVVNGLSARSPLHRVMAMSACVAIVHEAKTASLGK